MRNAQFVSMWAGLTCRVIQPQVDDLQVSPGPLNFNVSVLCLHVTPRFDLFRPFVPHTSTWCPHRFDCNARNIQEFICCMLTRCLGTDCIAMHCLRVWARFQYCATLARMCHQRLWRNWPTMNTTTIFTWDCRWYLKCCSLFSKWWTSNVSACIVTSSSWWQTRCMIQLLGSLTSWSFSTSRLLRLFCNLKHLHQCRPPETQVYVSMSLLGLIYFVHSCPCFVNTNNIEIWGAGDSGCIHRFE